MILHYKFKNIIPGIVILLSCFPSQAQVIQKNVKNPKVDYDRLSRIDDLVNEYVKLNQVTRFAQIPQVRYINFLSDFFASEKNATREQAIRAWQKIKKIDVPKTYRSWVELRSKPK